MTPIKEATNVAALPCAKGLVQHLTEASMIVSGTLPSELMRADTADVVEFTRTFVALRDVKDRIDEVQKKISSLYEEWKNVKVPEKFDKAGVPFVPLEEGFRVSVSHRVFASIKKESREAAFQWLRDNQLADLVTETVNSSTLSAVAKSMAEENRELNPDYFTVAVVANTSVTKTK